MIKELSEQMAKILSHGLTTDLLKAYKKAVISVEVKHKTTTFVLPQKAMNKINWLGFGKPPEGLNTFK